MDGSQVSRYQVLGFLGERGANQQSQGLARFERSIVAGSKVVDGGLGVPREQVEDALDIYRREADLGEATGLQAEKEVQEARVDNGPCVDRVGVDGEKDASAEVGKVPLVKEVDVEEEALLLGLREAEEPQDGVAGR